MATVIDAIMRLKDQFSPVMRQVNRSASEHTKIQRRLEKSLESTRKQFSRLGTGAIIGGAAMAGAISAAVKANLELEGAIGKLNAAGAMSSESMSGMREQINKTAEAAHMARSDVAALYLTAKQGGMEAAQIQGTVAAAINYAKVAGMDKAEAVKNMAQITRAWTLTEKDQAAAMDQAARIASKTSQELGPFQTMLAGMSEHAAHAGVSFGDLSTTMGYLRGNMHMTAEQSQAAMAGLFKTLEGGAPKASKALAGIGMTSQQLAENVKKDGLGPAMADVAKQVAAGGGDVAGTLKKIMGSTDGAKLAMQLMSADGMSNFKDLASACQNSAGSVQDGLKKLAENPAVQFANAKQDILTQLEEIVGDFFPLFTGGMQIITGLIKVFKELPAPVKGGIEALAGLAVGMTAVAVLAGTVGSTLISGITLFVKMIPHIKQAAIAVRTFGMAIAANPLGLMIIGIGLLVAGLIYAYKHCEMFRKGVNAAFESIKTKTGPVLERVKEAIQKFGEKIKTIAEKIKTYIMQELAKIAAFYSKHKDTIDAILNAIGSVIGVVCDLIVNYFSTAFSVIGDVLATFINVAGDVIGFIVDVFTGNWAGAWEHVKQIFADIWEGIKNIFNDVIGGISKALDRIMGKASDAKSAASDARTAGGDSESGDENSESNDGEEPDQTASGTNSWRGGLTYIHERGGELVDLPRGSRVYPHDKSLQMEYQRGQREAAAAGGGSITIAKLADSITVHDKQDIDDIANALIYKLKVHGIDKMVGAI